MVMVIAVMMIVRLSFRLRHLPQELQTAHTLRRVLSRRLRRHQVRQTQRHHHPLETLDIHRVIVAVSGEKLLNVFFGDLRRLCVVVVLGGIVVIVASVALLANFCLIFPLIVEITGGNVS